MACRISERAIDAADPGRLAAFWSQVLGYVELGREDDGSIEIGPPDCGLRPACSLPSSSAPVPTRGPGSSGCTSTSTPPIVTRTPSWSGCSLSAPGPPTSAKPAPRAGTFWPTQQGKAYFCLLHTRLQPL